MGMFKKNKLIDILIYIFAQISCCDHEGDRKHQELSVGYSKEKKRQ